MNRQLTEIFVEENPAILTGLFSLKHLCYFTYDEYIYRYLHFERRLIHALIVILYNDGTTFEIIILNFAASDTRRNFAY